MNAKPAGKQGAETLAPSGPVHVSHSLIVWRGGAGRTLAAARPGRNAAVVGAGAVGGPAIGRKGQCAL